MQEIIFIANEICVTVFYDIGYIHFLIEQLLDALFTATLTFNTVFQIFENFCMKKKW